MNNLNGNFKLNGYSFTSVNALITYSKKVSTSIHSFLEDWFSERKIINVKTSGSTGEPKIIELKKEYMVHSAMATGAFFDLPENTTALLCLSSDYIAGKMMLVRAMSLGWHLDVVDPSSDPLQQTNKNYDFCAMVPMQVYHSLDGLNRITKLIVGGGAINNELFMQLQSVRTDVYATYGMTETITHIAVRKLNGLKKSREGACSFYKTLPHVKITTDTRGCLVIDAPKISSKIIVTNDLVEVLGNNEFKWLGRVDNVINSGGIKLIPEQIEERLSKIIYQRFFVVGVPDKILGEKLILLVESNENISKITSKISDFLLLKKNEKPKQVYAVNQFIYTETEKINRKATLQLLDIN